MTSETHRYSETEQNIQKQIMLALSPHGAVFRTNAGEFYQGKRVYSKEFNQSVLINLRKIDGLPKGFSDLTMVVKGGRVAFIEVKSETGKPSPEQLNFIEQMRKLGCYAGVARSADEALKIIRK